MKSFFRYIAYPFKVVGNVLRLLVNLSSQQIKALFSLAMLGGMISLSFQNAALTYVAKQAVEQGDTFRVFFNLIQEQMRFNSVLIAWFALIMGLIVFGADFFRARIGNKEVNFGRGQDVPDNPMPTDQPQEPEFDL
jgi:hypothetical protein